MHVLVTGGNSFVGQHIIRSFTLAGVRVTATARQIPLRSVESQSDLESPKVVCIDWSKDYNHSEMPQGVDALVHLAGVDCNGDFASQRAMLNCNVIGTSNVIRYAQEVRAKRMVFASSMSIYGDVNERVVDQHTKVWNPSAYGASKLMAERIFASCAESLPCVAIRLPGVLGKGAHRAWIPTLLDRACLGKPITIYNPDESFNNAVHVADISTFFLRLLQGGWSGFHAFPVGASGSASIRQVVELVTSVAKKPVRIRIEPPRRSSFTISSAYAIQKFGYAPMDISSMLQVYASESA